MSDTTLWNDVDRYINSHLVGEDDALDAALQASDDAGLPAIAVAPNQGKLLHLIARIRGARRILEVGTLGGYSAIWMARALPADGRLVTLELDPHHAEVAEANLERAGVGDRVTVRVGQAIDTLRALVDEGVDPFDLVFIDADKQSGADYFAAAMQLTRPGSIIIVDNVVRSGDIVNESSNEAATVGTRRLYEAMAAEPRVTATAVQTVGLKGHDGFSLALVTG